ncbi:Non-receptor tyrosine-protein kinase TNK1, variant 2 [Balamuthia mandrillaris]
MFDNSHASSDEPKKEKEESKKDDTKKQKKKKAAAKAPDSPIPCTKAEEGGESKSRGGSKRSKFTKKQLTPSSSSASSPTPVKRDMSMTSLLDALDLICDQPDEERARRRSFKGHLNRPVAPSYSFTPFVPSTPPTSYASFGGHRGEAKEKEKERIEKNQIDKAEEREEVDKEESEQKAEREETVSSPVTERRQGVAFVPYKELSFIKKIGEGEYGVVFYGKWDDEEVAIKQLHSIDESQQMMLMKEAHLMGSLSTHPNVIRIIGVSLERNNPSCILTEFMPGGSLLTYLHQLSEAPSQTQQVRMALDVARGMRHLHANRITHRDLATRNLLLDNDLTIKVSDFGMSRRLNSDTEVTKSNTGPLKWMPPESLINRQYSEKSDVWAFAVTMWEVANKGAVPYAELNNIATAIAVMNASPYLLQTSPSLLWFQLCFLPLTTSKNINSYHFGLLLHSTKIVSKPFESLHATQRW